MKKTAILTIVLMSLLVFSVSASFGQELHKAAYDGNIELVKKILKTSPDPDARDSFGGTALHAAMF